MILNIIGIGVDIASIERVNKIANPNKILTQNEYKIWSSYQNEKHKMRYFAARWAAKEAAFKALPKLKLLTHAIKYIETMNYDNGQPYLNLFPAIREDLKKIYGNFKMEISLSYEKDTVVAFCIAFS